jgi:hypothetical protein
MPTGPISAPELIQYLQLPDSVKMMMAVPHSLSQQKFRERQRIEIYALNAIMTRWVLIGSGVGPPPPHPVGGGGGGGVFQ